MERGGVRQGSQTLPAGPTPVQSEDITTVLVELQMRRRELEELTALKDERLQKLESLDQRVDELQKEIEKQEELKSSLGLKEKEASRAAEKAEKEWREALKKQAEVKKLQEKLAALTDRKQELQHQVQRHQKYADFMEQVVKMTKFEDVEQFARHIENLLRVKGRFLQKESETEEKADRLKKELRTLEDQHRLMRLDKNNQLSQLHTELEKTRSEALTWERRWDHILEMSAEKKVKLAQMKLAVLNLYEVARSSTEGQEEVDINDTETQLEKVKMFLLDLEDIVKQYQTPPEKKNTRKKKRERKKSAKK